MYLGIDIGGTNFKYSVSNLDRFEIEAKSFPIDSNNSKSFILTKIDEILASNDISKVGIGLPGIISQSGIIKTLSNLPEWDNFDFKAFFDNRNIPCYIDNDANIAALAELYEGEGKHLDNFIYITLGTGIGAGIIINRNILRGDSDAAGEIGFTIIDRSANLSKSSAQFRVGTVEEYAGRMAILRLAYEIKLKYPESMLNNIDNFDVIDIDRFAKSGDEASIEVLNTTAYNISIAVTNIVNLLDIHTVILGGGIAASHLIINQIYNNTKLRVLPHITEKLVIKNAKFLSNTGVIGSLIAAKFLAI